MLLNYLNDKYPDLEYCTSTSNEYAFLSQYISYFNTYPNIKEIVPYFDVNRNFRLLKNLKKTFPNLDIEMMVNEGCLHGCAFRSFHPLSLPSSIYESEEDLSKREAAIIYCTNRNCTKIFDADPFGQLFKSNIIYPWDIEEYAKIGINRFKLVGRDNHSFFTGDFLEYYYIYLKGVDNYKDILDRPFYVLNNYINNSKHQIPFSIKEIIDYIPKVEYFVKNGHRCLSECGVTCTYCDDCAKKFQKMLDSKKTKN